MILAPDSEDQIGEHTFNLIIQSEEYPRYIGTKQMQIDVTVLEAKKCILSRQNAISDLYIQLSGDSTGQTSFIGKLNKDSEDCPTDLLVQLCSASALNRCIGNEENFPLDNGARVSLTLINVGLEGNSGFELTL